MIFKYTQNLVQKYKFLSRKAIKSEQNYALSSFFSLILHRLRKKQKRWFSNTTF